MINIGCDIKIGTNIENAGSVTINADGAVNTQKEEPHGEFVDYKELADCISNSAPYKEATIPTDLSTPDALDILSKLHNRGFLSEDFHPDPRLSLKEKVILAGMISQTLWQGKNRWALFNDFWNIRNMSSLYSQAMKQHKSGEFIESINRALRD